MKIRPIIRREKASQFWVLTGSYFSFGTNGWLDRHTGGRQLPTTKKLSNRNGGSQKKTKEIGVE
jgi:hypothetical protein